MDMDLKAFADIVFTVREKVAPQTAMSFVEGWCSKEGLTIYPKKSFLV